MVTLTYELLDELELAFAMGGAIQEDIELEVRSVGPLIQLQRSAAWGAISRSKIKYGGLSDAASFSLAPKGLFLSAGKNIGIASATTDGAADELMQRALLAINKAHFPRGAAAQAVSAIGELESNIREHSEDAIHGLVAFEVQASFVGIYASDCGIGVLSSLRKNSVFKTLEDSGSALRMALREGVSSTGEPGRGMGFRPIFVGLASLAALLRFRTGDSLLEINNYGGGTPIETLRERASIPGFHAFVHCTFN